MTAKLIDEKDWIDKAYYMFDKWIRWVFDSQSEVFRNSIEYNIPSLDTAKLDISKYIYTKEYYDWLPVDEEVLSQDWKYIMIGKRFNGKIYINDFTSLKSQQSGDSIPAVEEDYVKVPKDIYEKMSGECTLAAIRRWDFVEVESQPVEPSEQVAKVNKNKNGDYTCWYCDCIDIEDYTCYCPMCGRKLSRVD